MSTTMNFHILVKWPPIGKIAAHSTYDMFSWYLIVNLVFSHLVFLSGNLFLIALFPDLCLLPFYFNDLKTQTVLSS